MSRKSVQRQVQGFEAHSFWTIFTVSAVIRVVKILLSPPHNEFDINELEKVARSVALHGSFADTYLHPTGPSAHIAPGGALILGLIYWIFGIGWQGEMAKRCAAALVSSLQYALLPRAAVAMGLTSMTGAAIGLLSALAPYKGFMETDATSWEQPYVAGALILLFLHTLRYWSTDKIPVRAAMLRGLWWGLAVLLSPMLILVFGAIVAYEFLALRRRERLAWALLIFVGVQIPWAVRNWIELHGLVWSRSNFGLEFLVSNRPESFALMEDNVSHGILTRFHPSQSEFEWERLNRLGEVAYNRAELETALVFVKKDRARFARMTFERIWRFWLEPSRRRKGTLTTTAVTLLGAIGLWAMPRGPGRRLIFLILLSYPLIYYFIQTDRRYRYPIEWMFLPPAAYAISRLRRGSQAMDQSSSLPRNIMSSG